MNNTTSTVIYQLFCIIVMLYLSILGCYMLMRRENTTCTDGEQESKLRMTRTIGIAMFGWAFEWFIYMPPILAGCSWDHPIYKVLFNVVLIISIPIIYNTMFAVVQRRVNMLKWTCVSGVPFFILAIWQMTDPQNYKPVYTGAFLSVASILFLLIRFASEYRIYVNRIQSEYSEITGREILWSWICFSSFAIQGIFFVAYQLLWSPVLEVSYNAISLFNATFLCFCTCKQRTIDIEIVEGEEEEASGATPEHNKEKESAFYATIEEKLKMYCEDKRLYLEPDLTREALCRSLSISSTYLKMYFHSRGLTFYQYVNTLRAEYAYNLMQENPNMSIREISEHSGFRSQTTFRNVFHDIMGCLPSEARKEKIIPHSHLHRRAGSVCDV